MKQSSIYDSFKIQSLQYCDSHICVILNIVIEKDIDVSDKKNLYILLFVGLYNTLHREETSPAYFFPKIWRK